MKLDTRIIKGKKPLTCFDSDEVKQFIGQNGFFSDYVIKFMDLNRLHRSKLVLVKKTFLIDEYGCGYTFFLPEEYVMTEDEYFTFSDNAKSIALEIFNLIQQRMSERNLKKFGTDRLVDEIIMKLQGIIK